jgi:hypothetical protein
MPNRLPWRCGHILVALVISLTPAQGAVASIGAKPGRLVPLSDGEAAARVSRKQWEPRLGNAAENRRIPSVEQLAAFHGRSEMINRYGVTGRYRGTTDEILQWAARKWGFDPDLFRAVAYVESRWRMSAVGDGGLSFGIFQMKRTYHCCVPLSSRYTAFNADYYGGILRAYYDGSQIWLNDVEGGARYHAGDLWGSVGAWYAGRWWTHPAVDYIHKVRDALRREPWRRHGGAAASNVAGERGPAPRGARGSSRGFRH